MPLFFLNNVLIEYKWSQWFYFKNIDLISNIENKEGVWVIRDNNKKILYIGYSKRLKNRIINQFYYGKGKHSTRDRMIKNNVNFDELEFKFTYIDKYIELKKNLLITYQKVFKKLPKYMKKA
ncbi:GIY-YIG nuclease family protein [Caminibacter mediatlanticus]|uniref:GIY-YIG nuclease family protein n=1 Tax=Caminibacter mediatlanticus TaxID=291048 RepID=UPI001585D80E|nr:GIY-YIG nuclease family protein [Caminibacter mediatlanticus]